MRVPAALFGLALLGAGCGGECLRVRTAAYEAHASLDDGFALLRTMPPAAAEASLREALDEALDDVARVPEDGFYRRRVQIYQHTLVETADRLDDLKQAIAAREEAEESLRARKRTRRETAARLREACQGETLTAVDAILGAHDAPGDEREALSSLEGVPASPLGEHLASLAALEAATEALPLHAAAIARVRTEVEAMAVRERVAYEALRDACPL